MRPFKVSFAALMGLTLGIFFVVGAIGMSGNFRSFLNWPSVFITIGGTTASMILAFPLNRLKTFGSVFLRAFRKDEYDLEQDIKTIVGFSEIARRQGFLALEEAVDRNTDDEFLKKELCLS